MDPAAFPEEVTEQKKVRIVGSELVDNYTVYIIEVTVGDHQWTIKHRYSDFHDLHEKLTAEKKIDKNLLPPKKMIGKNSKSLVEKRQKELEVYLQTLLVRFPLAAPKVLSCFLHFHLYEINGITAALAEDLFHKGEQLLVVGEVFLLRPLQLYAITQQLKLAKPTCANGDAKADLGHILDFTCRLKYLKIPGAKGVVGTSNIQEHLLPFDLSVFKSLLQIEISHCDSKQIVGLPFLRLTVATMSIHYSAVSMKDILVPEAAEFAQWEAEGVASDCPVTAIIPTWKTLTTLDMSHNQISCIDESVKLIPKVEFLDLSYNELSLVENLQHLYNLIHLDLSYNKLTVLEGVHTKLGNIKTLNLAGNQLESLSGLNKLYSLVNLDLSNNKLSQFEEIRNIGTLPCLEKLSLTNNPLSIIPDYRTKVLAQFWDRASEVCLDGTATTEKELDTVEVLKAIQKAKEAKDRMANSEKKICEDSRLSAGGSHSPSSSLAAPPCSSPLSHTASSSQEVICKEEALVTSKVLTPVDSAITQRCYNVQNSSCEESLQIKTQPIAPCLSLQFTSDQQMSCCCCAEDRGVLTDCRVTPVLPFSLASYTAANLDFTAQLAARISRAVWETERKPPPQREAQCGEPKDRGSQSSGDGYFEMGLCKGEEGSVCSASSDGLAESSEEADVEIIRVVKVMWAHCVQVGKSVAQLPACVVLAEGLLVVYQVPRGELRKTVKDLVESLETDLLVPYTEVEGVRFDVPEMCLSLKVKSSEARLYFLSDFQSLKEMHSFFCTLVKGSPSELTDSAGTPQQLIRQLLNSWEFDENDCVVKGAFSAHLLDPAMLTSLNQQDPVTLQKPTGSPLSDILSHVSPAEAENDSSCLPCFAFLTPRHLCVLKVDFCALAGDPLEGQRPRSCMKLTRIPLAALLLRPRQGCAGGSSLPGHWLRDGHVLELMAGHEFVTAVFPLPHDKFLFLRLFGQLRSSLKDIKTVAFLQTAPCHRKTNTHQTPSKIIQREPLSSVPQGVQRPHLTLSLLYPSDPLVQKLSDENQCPSHLSISPSLHFLSELRGKELVEFFYNNIAEVENEELKHILWSSVLFYKSPDVEMTACIMLSTKALYFILDDTASTLSDQAMLWNWSPLNQEETDFIISYCFAMKLNDLQSVNVGLFDQYFRVVGPSADHIISCLTRDSYGTHHFLQQLMTVLSLLEKLPSPEPTEQDFYTQFGNKSTGKMENYELVHSSKVKFVYPSEEEIGDLTFIVAERKGGPSHSLSFNILFYVLAFQVQNGQGPSAESQQLLQPKTLILTSSDIFLLEEDYISYPLPTFAKEPPQRDKYRLTDARRIRDLDRVLMGYQTYPQALTLVFDDVPGPDLLCHLTMDHFAESQGGADRARGGGGGVDESEVQWCVFVPGADSRERLISLLARQWEMLCSRELPVELTG
ncbi:nischarin isoform X1 [Megalops cyprinoides]|uniref:nischarin isoform X1 n=1 Tax=Megalops cyprinoides TaxID=118141 RepID=UPI0018642C85|nr:nischarin isoform X1 [Megalops cyprinoides]